jgi:hypothetical protein
MKEFLDTIKNEGLLTKQEMVPKVMLSLEHWIQRVPNSAFDQLSVWDDILTARNLYLDLYTFKLQEDFKLGLS